MTDRFMNADGTISGFQPGDKIISPAAAEFNAEMNRLMKKTGPLKKDDSFAWASQTEIAIDDNGHLAQIVEPKRRSPGESKYSIIYHKSV